MLEHLDDITWSSFAQPEWNKADTVPRVLRMLAACSSEEEGQEAYHRVLFALGNNHAGCFHAVVLPALPFLGEILEHGGEHARLATLNILCELNGSFGSCLEFAAVRMSDGTQMGLGTLVRQGTLRFTSIIEAILFSNARSREERELAAELLGYMAQEMVELVEDWWAYKVAPEGSFYEWRYARAHER